METLCPKAIDVWGYEYAINDLKVCLSTLKVHKAIASVRTLHQPYESLVIKSKARIVLSAIIKEWLGLGFRVDRAKLGALVILDC
jgi:hypothetical protein